MTRRQSGKNPFLIPRKINPILKSMRKKIIQLMIIILILLSNYLKCIDSGPAEDAEESEEQSEEAKEMTFEEWKELQEKYRSKMSYDMRKPGEGEKKGQWKNTKVLTKKSDEDDDRQQVFFSF